MMRKMYVMLVAVLVVALACSLAWAAKGGKSPKASSGVTVTTVDASGKGKPVPMPGVKVDLFILNAGYVTTGVTDDNAQVEFANLLPNTTYRLLGTAPDGRTTAGGFTTNDGGSAKPQTLSFWEPLP